MNRSDFALQPFPAGAGLPAVAISGALERRGTFFAITFAISGQLQEVLLPLPTPNPARRWLLWEATCCEFFLAVPGAEDYWEVNLSPAGHWNVFHLAGYRRGIQEEVAISLPALTVRRYREKITVSLAVDLAAILPADKPWEVAISCVLQDAQGQLSYWALNHPAGQPDFHHPASFIITI